MLYSLQPMRVREQPFLMDVARNLTIAALHVQPRAMLAPFVMERSTNASVKAARPT